MENPGLLAQYVKQSDYNLTSGIDVPHLSDIYLKITNKFSIIQLFTMKYRLV